MIGQILRRRYKITKELGNGGFGKTYLAEYPCDLPVTPQYHCVIKELIRPSTPDLDTEERFKKEAAVLFKLGKNHSQIPELYDFFEENRKFYLVQEYIDGQDLSYEITSGQQWSEAEVIQLLQAWYFNNEELARVSIEKNYGYINKSGKFVIPAQFNEADDFAEGLARVKIGEQERYIDKNGRFIY